MFNQGHQAGSLDAASLKIDLGGFVDVTGLPKPQAQKSLQQPPQMPKAKLLEQSGANHIINYRETPDWGEQAKALASDRTGVQHVIEVGGPATIAQSLKAVAIDGVISIIGFIGGSSKEQQMFLELFELEGILVGSRMQFEDMSKAIEAKNIHPIVDEWEFCLEQLKEVYQYVCLIRNFGKVTIKIA
ncbi:unnamed protein product [Alternaria alternata]